MTLISTFFNKVIFTAESINHKIIKLHTLLPVLGSHIKFKRY